MLKTKEVLIITALSIALLGGVISNPNAHVNAEKNCDTPGTHHDDNNPSTKKFKQQGDICEMAKCVDTEECANHVRVSDSQLHKLLNSAEGDEQKCLEKWSKDGHGADGLVGYEVLKCANGQY